MAGMEKADAEMAGTEKAGTADQDDAKPSDAAAVRVVSIVGPTASGKTRLGIDLARRLTQADGIPCEIVNADAYQMYRGMDVGTAKPTPEERAEVPHHLIDCIDPDENMSVALFQDMARRCIRELQGRGVRPILVGGSGLYARAAIDDISFPPTDPAVRSRLEKEAEDIGPDALFDRLRGKDPEAAAHMDPKNVRRTVRALEVIELTARTYSSTLPRYHYVIPSVQIGLDMSREQLDRRIDERTRLMREQGFVDEVERLRPHLGVTASRALGYQQIADVLDGLMDEDEAFALIAQKTRRLARKQMGWFGRDPRIHWLTAGSPGLAERAAAIVHEADRGAYDAIDAHADEYVQHHLGTLRTERLG